MLYLALHLRHCQQFVRVSTPTEAAWLREYHLCQLQTTETDTQDRQTAATLQTAASLLSMLPNNISCQLILSYTFCKSPPAAKLLLQQTTACQEAHPPCSTGCTLNEPAAAIAAYVNYICNCHSHAVTVKHREEHVHHLAYGFMLMQVKEA